MRRSQRLRLSDVRGVFRVLGDARDLRHDPIQQEVMIVDAMAELLDASFGHAMQIGEFRPKARTHVRRLVPGSIQDSRVVRYLSEWGIQSEFDDDPLKHVTWDKPGPVYTTSRSREMRYDDVRPHRIFEEMIEPAGINDVVLTFFRYPGSNVVREYGFIRTLKQKEYEPRQLRVAHLFITELYRLYRKGDLDLRDLLSDLPPRLARLARQLMTARSQRRIAESQNLSYQTVRSYTKELYDTVGVSSREELIALIRNRSN